MRNFLLTSTCLSVVLVSAFAAPAFADLKRSGDGVVKPPVVVSPPPPVVVLPPKSGDVKPPPVVVSPPPPPPVVVSPPPPPPVVVSPPPPAVPPPTTSGYNPSKLPNGSQRAFPTAEGFGASATGGRGGVIIPVTTLADSGTGSLRACMMATVARTCVFRVSGTIELLSQIKPTFGNLTIAGQTSPGGIAIRNAPSNLTGSPLFFAKPNNIVRHIRVRPGPTSGAKQDTTDAITVDSGATNSIFDHVSLSWATDEPFNSTKAVKNITVQWSLVYEGLSKSTHKAGEHSKGMFMEGSDITLHHTLIAHGTDRMPNFGVGARADVVNVISYDMREKAHQYFSMMQKTSATNSGLTRTANIIGNWVSMGPSSRSGIFGGNYIEEYSTNPGFASFYLLGNIDGRRQNLNMENRLFFDPLDWKYLTNNVIGTLSVEKYTSAEQAVRDITMYAGAFPRDASDQRAINNFLSCKGAIIDDPSQVGGWPQLTASASYPDLDADGMDDNWEKARGIIDPLLDADRDGYTNLEEYLNELAGDQTPAGTVILRTGTGQGSVPPVNCGKSV